MSLTAHTGVQGEAVGLGDTFQSRIRPLQWADGANHESLATLLRADRDPIRHGTTQKVRQGPPLFMGVASVSSAGSSSSQALSVSGSSKPWRSRQRPTR